MFANLVGARAAVRRAAGSSVVVIVAAGLLMHCSTSNVGSRDDGGNRGVPPKGDGGRTEAGRNVEAGIVARSDASVSADAESRSDARSDSASCVALEPGAEPPSCASGGAGTTNCGPCSESCCTSLAVTGGTFARTYDLTDAGLPAPPLDGGATRNGDPASVSGFRLDKYLVTVGRFRAFVSAWNGGAGYVPPVGSGKHAHLNAGQGLANSAIAGTFEPGWAAADDANIAPTDENLACFPDYASWTSMAGGQENFPINCVTWQEAYAFCIWDEGFLPSEAEWEYAAAGGALQREYPWGASAPGTSNGFAIYDCNYPNGPASCTGLANLAPVGSAPKGAGLWGQLDLAGEVFEWNLDWYATYASPCVDCADTTAGSNRVIHGGYFVYDATFLLPPNRGNYPQGRNNGVGFRCARTP